MEMVVEENAEVRPHTAITTWSGFVYQGKVAIHHVLHLINNVSRDYILQLDSLEDFAILDNSDAIISLHQVKALKTQYYSGYKDAFDKLNRKSNECGCKKAKFHIARQITDETVAEISRKHSPVDLYMYGTNSWCAVDEIDNKIEEEIENFFTVNLPGDVYKKSKDYVRKTKSYLDQIILIKILAIHRIVHDNLMSDREAAYRQTIPFEDFINILNKDLNQDDQGTNYYFYVLLNDLLRYHQDYCIDYDDLAQDDLVKLSSYMKEICSLDFEGMVQFIQNIMPHREFKFETLEDYKDHSIDKDGIQHGFLATLSGLRKTDLNQGKYFRWEADNRFFTPTTIDKGSSLDSRVCRNIVENAQNTDLDIMYEGNNLITTDINVESITEKVPELVQGIGSSDRESERVSRWRKVSLISLNKARDIIND